MGATVINGLPPAAQLCRMKLPVPLAIIVAVILPTVLAFVPTFTGHVDVDFPATNPNVFINTNQYAPIWWGNHYPSGWNIVDVRYTYNVATDTAYIGTSTSSSTTTVNALR